MAWYGWLVVGLVLLALYLFIGWWLWRSRWWPPAWLETLFAPASFIVFISEGLFRDVWRKS